MKVAIISNCDLCMPLLQYCRQANLETILYAGLYNPGTDLSAVLAFCNGNDIKVEIEKDPAQLYKWLALHKPAYSFVFGYKKLIDVGKLGELRERIFNIHPGRLPQYRGASPVFWQLKNGEPVLAITVHFIPNKYDAGHVAWSREIKNESHFTHGLVEYIFCNMAVEGVAFILNMGSKGLLGPGRAQDESLAAVYKTPALKDVLIDWNTMHAAVIVNLVKACNHWNKGAITTYSNTEVKIMDAEVLPGNAEKAAGTVTAVGQGFIVACAGNSSMVVHSLSINGLFVPARFADKFGFAVGQAFSRPNNL